MSCRPATSADAGAACAPVRHARAPGSRRGSGCRRSPAAPAPISRSGNRRASSSRLSRSERRWLASVSSARTCAPEPSCAMPAVTMRNSSRRPAAGGAGRSARFATSSSSGLVSARTVRSCASALPRQASNAAFATLPACAATVGHHLPSRPSSRFLLAVSTRGPPRSGRPFRAPCDRRPSASISARSSAGESQPSVSRQCQHPDAHRRFVGVAREFEIAFTRAVVAAILASAAEN